MGTITADTFWKLYFNRHFVQLRRSTETYEGVYDDYENPIAGGLFTIPAETSFSILTEDLAAYDYGNDERFQQRHERIETALSERLKAPPYDTYAEVPARALQMVAEWIDLPADEVKHIQQEGVREEEYQQARVLLMELLETVDITRKKIVVYLQKHAPSDEDRAEFEKTGSPRALQLERELLVDALSCCREASLREGLFAVVSNPQDDPMLTRRAARGIARHNQKEDAPRLLTLLRDDRLTAVHPALQEALSFMCSGPELIKNRSEQRAADFWDTKYHRHLPETEAAWIKHDSKSVFWEKRMQAALGFTPDAHEQSTIEQLMEDEVGLVRDVAQQRAKKLDELGFTVPG